MEIQFLNKNQFTKMVENVVHEKRLSYIEAIINICNENNLEVEDVSKYITGIVSRIRLRQKQET
jgi:UDP-glucose 6-dehydrogenase